MTRELMTTGRIGQTLMMDIFRHNQHIESKFHKNLTRLFRIHLQIEDVSQYALGSLDTRRWEKV